MHYRVISNTNGLVIAEFEFQTDAITFAARWNELFSHDHHVTKERYVVKNVRTDYSEIPYLDNISTLV